ncbi:MAG: hypothetical protein AAF481_12675 [Acidobacteriota bacterium]
MSALRIHVRLSLVLSVVAIALLAPGCSLVKSSANYTQQNFPVGSSNSNAETAWRVTWAFEPHPYDANEQIWVLTGAEFMRGRKTVNGQSVEDWVRVLDRMAVAAMFVPYVENGNRYADFLGYYTGLAQLDAKALNKQAYKPSTLYQDKLMKERTDDFVRWMEVGPGGYHAAARLRRGQAMTLWGMFSAYNYVYPVAFKFRDDGVIQVRIAASGQNLAHAPIASNSHLHMGAWRIEPHLCALGNSSCSPDQVNIEKVSRRVVNGQETIVKENFNGGTEGGTDWNPDEFTALLATNPTEANGRPIPCTGGQTPPCTSQEPIGYALLPIRFGRARFKASQTEGFLDHELWVTRRPSPPDPAEIFFADVSTYANGQSLSGQRKVIWHKSAYNHIPRYEDLGIGQNNSFNKHDGVAITNFTGFDLVPRNLMFKTPLYTP